MEIETLRLNSIAIMGMLRELTNQSHYGHLPRYLISGVEVNADRPILEKIKMEQRLRDYAPLRPPMECESTLQKIYKNVKIAMDAGEIQIVFIFRFDDPEYFELAYLNRVCTWLADKQGLPSYRKKRIGRKAVQTELTVWWGEKPVKL